MVRNGIKTIIPLTLIVVAHADKLLDLSAEIVTKEILSGDNLTFNIKVLNLGRFPRYDVSLTYTISNANTGEVIYQQTETMAIETSLNFSRSIKIPEETSSGKYALKVTATYDNETAIAAEQFTIIEKEKVKEIELQLYLFLFIVVLMIILILEFYSKAKDRKRRIKEIMKLKNRLEMEHIKSIIHQKTSKKHIRKKRKIVKKHAKPVSSKIKEIKNEEKRFQKALDKLLKKERSLR